jgi:hypothetical protein
VAFLDFENQKVEILPHFFILENAGSGNALHLNPDPRADFQLKVHKNENLFGFDFEFCTISMLVMHK